MCSRMLYIYIFIWYKYLQEHMYVNCEYESDHVKKRNFLRDISRIYMYIGLVLNCFVIVIVHISLPGSSLPSIYRTLPNPLDL